MANIFKSSRGAYGADLNMIEQINAFQDTTRLDKNLKEIRNLLNEFYKNELSDFKSAIQKQLRTGNNYGDFRSNSSTPLSNSDKNAFQNMGQQAGETYTKSMEKAIDRTDWGKIGANVGSKLADGIFQTFSKAFNSWVSNTYGSVEVAGSFGRGNSLFAQMRSELGNLSFGQNTLKDFGKAIENSYRNLHEQGLVVSPTVIYSMYSKLGDLVNISASSGGRLTSLLNTVTEMSRAGGGKFDTSSYAMQRLTAVYGEDIAKDIQAMFNISASQFENSQLTTEALNTIMNSKAMESLIRYTQTSGMNENQSRTFLRQQGEDLAQTWAYLGGSGLTENALIELSGMLDKAATSSQEQFAGLFKTNSRLAALLTGSGLDTNQLLTQEGFARNVDDILTTLVTAAGGYSVSGGKLSAEDMEMSRKVLMNAFGVDVSQSGVLEELQLLMGSGKLSGLQNYVGGSISQQQIDRYYLAQNEQNELTAELNNQLELLGLKISDDTYDSQVLGWLTVIGNKLTQVLGNDTISSVISGAGNLLSTSLLAGIMKGTGTVAAGAGISGGGGLLGALGTAGPIALAVGAATAAGVMIANNIKSQHETSNKHYENISGSIMDIASTNGPLYEINENTKTITRTVSEDAADAFDFSDVGFQYSIDDKGNFHTNTVSLKQLGISKEDLDKQNAEALFNNMTMRGFGVEGKNEFIYEGGDRNNPVAYRDYISRWQSGEISDSQFVHDISRAGVYTDNASVRWRTGSIFNPNIRMTEEARTAAFFEELMNEPYAPYLFELYNWYYTSGRLGKQEDSSLFSWNTGTKDFYKNIAEVWQHASNSEAKGFGNSTYSDDYISTPNMPKLRYSQYSGDIANIKNKLDVYGLSIGTDAVPYDGYPAILHAGEMVIPAKRANYIRAMLGMKTVTPSTYFADRKTGNNSFVQSIPEYASGTDNPADTALQFAISQIGVPYGMQDCSDLVSNAFRSGRGGVPGAGLNVPDSTAAGIGQNWPKYGFSVIYSSPDSPYRNQKISKTEAAGLGLRPGDIILYDLDTDRTKDRYMQISHTALVYSDGIRQIHSTPKQKGTNISNLWNGIVKILRYGSGGTGSPVNYGTTSEGAVGGVKEIPESMKPLLQSKNPVVISMLRRLGYLGANGEVNAGAGEALNTDWASLNSNFASSPYANYLTMAANEFGIPTPLLLYGLMLRESSGNPDLNKNKATQYKGLMQVNMDSIRSVGGTDPYDPLTNIRAGAKHLYEAYKHRNIGYWTLATLAYNTGPGLKAYEGVHNEIAQNGFPGWDWITSYVKANSSKYPRFNAAAYGGRIYDMAGISPTQFLAEGGIVKSTPGGVPTVIGEGKYDEAVIPLNDNNDYLKIEEVGADIIDVLDTISTRICNKLDRLIELKQQQMKEDTMVLPTAQRSARTEALLSFRGNY